MGEYAEALLDGTFCQGCGELMIDEFETPPGHPVFCAVCERPPPTRGRPRNVAPGFGAAVKLGADHGVSVTNPTAGVVQFRWDSSILDFYPRKGRLRRVRGRVPYLQGNWTQDCEKICRRLIEALGR